MPAPMIRMDLSAIGIPSFPGVTGPFTPARRLRIVSARSRFVLLRSNIHQDWALVIDRTINLGVYLEV
jgi:hypothetical protein